MSYIAFDLDALQKTAPVARLCGASEDRVRSGLLDLWMLCWREKRDLVTDDEVNGLVWPGAARALATFGFVEPAGDLWRVKGASRYLRIKKAQSTAGKTHSKNLKQGSQSKTEVPGSPPAPPRVTPGSTRESIPALSASSDERLLLLLSEEAGETKKTKPPGKTTDPRHAPTLKALLAEFERLKGSKYGGKMGHAAGALGEMLALGPPEEILRRWREALVSNFPKVATVPELRERWDHFTPKPSPGGIIARPHQGSCVVCGGPGAAAFGDPPMPGCYPCIARWENWMETQREAGVDEPWKLASAWLADVKGDGHSASDPPAPLNERATTNGEVAAHIKTHAGNEIERWAV